MTPHLADRESLRQMSPGNQAEIAGRKSRRLRFLLSMGILALALFSLWVVLNALSDRPVQALKGTFQNPQAAQLIRFTQSGRKWIYPTLYTATVTAQGEDLRLRLYIKPSRNSNTIRRILGGWDACNDLFKKPETEILYYDNSDPQSTGVLGPGNTEIYGIYHPLTHTYCFVYVEV